MIEQLQVILMQKVVFFPTNNIGKYDRYIKSFNKENITYNRYLIDENGFEVKVNVVEDGETLKENAQKKAKAYYDEYKKYLGDTIFSIITTDEALYIDGLSDEEQPGLLVRRFGGMHAKRATDEEVVEKYTSVIKNLGGKVNAKWVYSLVMYDGESFYDYTWEEPVLFSDTPHYPITKGYVLNNITIVKKIGNDNIMLSDLTEDERVGYLSKYTDAVVCFVNEKLVNKTKQQFIKVYKTFNNTYDYDMNVYICTYTEKEYNDIKNMIYLIRIEVFI